MTRRGFLGSLFAAPLIWLGLKKKTPVAPFYRKTSLERLAKNFRFCSAHLVTRSPQHSHRIKFHRYDAL